MQVKVKVVSEKEYQEWAVKQPLFYNDDMKKQMQSAQVTDAAANTTLALTTSK
jgi:cytochrome c oxidase subunit 2